MAVQVESAMFAAQWGAGPALDLNSKGGEPGTPAVKGTFDLQHAGVLATRANTNGDVSLYVDGKLQASGSFAHGPRLATTALRVGARRFIGNLTDIRLYGRVLTANEIAAVAAGH